MITFQAERVSSCWEELYPLAMSHHRSTENYRRHEPFAPSRERYEQYNDMGMFHLLTARDEGRLVGYFGVYLTRSMHSQMPMATEDTFYLAPTHRGGRNALKFLLFVESYLRSFCEGSAGVEVMFSCEQDNDSGIQKLLGHLDYDPVITVFSKRLYPCADSASSVKEVSHACA